MSYLGPNGRLLEETTEGGRPYVGMNKDINAHRAVLYGVDGKEINATNGALAVTDGRVHKYFEGTGNRTETFTKECIVLGLINNSAADLTFTIGSVANVRVKPGESFLDSFEKFTQVTITATGAYRGFAKA